MPEPAATSTPINELRNEAHPACFICAPSHPGGLRLLFVPQVDGSVAAEFDCDIAYEGYSGVVHGGIVASLLDGAMTNCLFSMGHVAVTADLHVRFRHPLGTGQKATVRAWLTRNALPLFVLEAEIAQAGQVKATAVGKFMLRPGAAVGGER
jgi:acyl-coenzyme A thioesterase PaaI-like protein